MVDVVGAVAVVDVDLAPAGIHLEVASGGVEENDNGLHRDRLHQRDGVISGHLLPSGDLRDDGRGGWDAAYGGVVGVVGVRIVGGDAAVHDHVGERVLGPAASAA